MAKTCVCDGSCNVVNCPCNGVCNVYTACTCNSAAYYTCSCYTGCNLAYATCKGDSSCGCNAGCYVGYSCPCNSSCNSYAACSCNTSAYYTTCSCDSMKFAPGVWMFSCFPPMNLVEQGLVELLKKLRKNHAK